MRAALLPMSLLVACAWISDEDVARRRAELSVDTADSGATGDSGDTVDTADSGDSGATGDSGDTGACLDPVDCDGDGFATDGDSSDAATFDCDDTDPAVRPVVEVAAGGDVALALTNICPSGTVRLEASTYTVSDLVITDGTTLAGSTASGTTTTLVGVATPSAPMVTLTDGRVIGLALDGSGSSHQGAVSVDGVGELNDVRIALFTGRGPALRVTSSGELTGSGVVVEGCTSTTTPVLVEGASSLLGGGFVGTRGDTAGAIQVKVAGGGGLELRGSRFEATTSLGGGALAIDVADGDLLVDHATFAGVRLPDGSGADQRPIHWSRVGGSLVVEHAVFAFGTGAVLTRFGPTTARVSLSDLYEVGANPISASVTQSSNLTAEPGFVRFHPNAARTLWDLHLRADSALVDVDAGTKDTDGTDADLGAYGGPGVDMSWYADADRDGLPDGWQAQEGIAPLDAPADDPDVDTLDNAAEYDCGSIPILVDVDADGRADADECAAGTSPIAADTDGDGLDDGEERAAGTDPLLPDTDGDGLSDAEEVAGTTSPLRSDTDRDGIADGLEVLGTTDPADPDSDGDGILDGPDEAWEEDPAGIVASALGGGPRFACALASSGVPACWGDNADPGSGGYSGAASPTALQPQVAIASGPTATCVVDGTGEISCWGVGPVLSDPPSAPVTGATGLSVGADHACVLAGGAVSCWGSGTAASPPSAVQGVGSTQSIASGDRHACALSVDGQLTCWGASTGGATTAPPGAYDHLSAASDSACATTVEGEAVCWGASLGAVDPPAGPFLDVHAGSRQACGVAGDGSLVCWGEAPEASEIPSSGYLSVALGEGFGCGQSITDGLVCWGVGDAGQAIPPTETANEVLLGEDLVCLYTRAVGGPSASGRINCFGSATRSLQDPKSIPAAVDFTTGRGFQCFRNRLGVGEDTTICYGEGVGPGPMGTTMCPGITITDPERVPGVSCADAAAAGDAFLCLLRDAGTSSSNVSCYGTVPSSLQSAPPGTWTGISAGAEHACVIRASSGLVACWGRGSEGQLVGPSAAVSELAGGEGFHCGVRSSDGIPECWGDDTHGIVSNAPDTAILGITAGSSHACASRSDGVVCWGDGSVGQTRSPPALMGNKLSSGGDTSCATDGDSEVTCWGRYARQPLR